MNRTLPLLLAGLVAGSLTAPTTPAQEAKTESAAWTAPSRAARKKNPIAADAVSLDKGRTVYFKECASCHGDTGKGDGSAAKDLEKAPGDLTGAKLVSQSDGALFWKITEGNKPMASFDKTLSEEARWNVINYLRTLGAKSAK